MLDYKKFSVGVVQTDEKDSPKFFVVLQGRKTGYCVALSPGQNHPYGFLRPEHWKNSIYTSLEALFAYLRIRQLRWNPRKVEIEWKVYKNSLKP